MIKAVAAVAVCYDLRTRRHWRPSRDAAAELTLALLAAQIFTREVPFQGYDVVDIRRKVLAGERFRVPTLDCPEPCQALMRRCWDGEPSRRPMFTEICEVLRDVADSLQHGGSSHLQQPGYYGGSFEGDALDGLLQGR